MQQQQIFVSVDAAKAICENNERVLRKLKNLERVHAFTGKFGRNEEREQKSLPFRKYP